MVDARPCCWSGGGRPTEATGSSSPHAFSPHWTRRNRPLSGVFPLFPLPVNGAREGGGKTVADRVPSPATGGACREGCLGSWQGPGCFFRLPLLLPCRWEGMAAGRCSPLLFCPFWRTASGRERGWSLESDRGWRPSLCAPCPLPLEGDAVSLFYKRESPSLPGGWGRWGRELLDLHTLL